jgi:hypothetical protein
VAIIIAMIMVACQSTPSVMVVETVNVPGNSIHEFVKETSSPYSCRNEWYIYIQDRHSHDVYSTRSIKTSYTDIIQVDDYWRCSLRRDNQSVSREIMVVTCQSFDINDQLTQVEALSFRCSSNENEYVHQQTADLTINLECHCI